MSFEIRSHSALIRNLIDVLKSHLTPQNRSSMKSFQMLSAIVTFRFLPPLRSTLHNGWKNGCDLAEQGLRRCYHIVLEYIWHWQPRSDFFGRDYFSQIRLSACTLSFALELNFSDLAQAALMHHKNEIRWKARRHILREVFVESSHKLYFVWPSAKFSFFFVHKKARTILVAGGMSHVWLGSSGHNLMIQ